MPCIHGRYAPAIHGRYEYYSCIVLFLAFVRYQHTSVSITVLPNPTTQDISLFFEVQSCNTIEIKKKV